MTMERYIRMIAGLFVLASLGLGIWVNPNWFWFTAFVGANLLQSSITNWCLMEDILAREDEIRSVAREAVANSRRIYFVGAGPNALTAPEGALKAKEAAYVTAEGFDD